MTLREAMKILELNERTLELSMVQGAARQRMSLARTDQEQDQILEAFKRVQIFLDPSADERFSLRGSNVLAALSDPQEEPASRQPNAAFEPVVGLAEPEPDLSAPLFMAEPDSSPAETVLFGAEPETTPPQEQAFLDAPQEQAFLDAPQEQAFLDAPQEQAFAPQVSTPDKSPLEADLSGLEFGLNPEPDSQPTDNAGADLDFDVEMSFDAAVEANADQNNLEPNDPVESFEATQANLTPAVEAAPLNAALLDEEPIPVLDDIPIPVLDDPPAPQPMIIKGANKPVIDSKKTLEFHPEFDDALLLPRQAPRDASALTIIEDNPGTRGKKKRPAAQDNRPNDRRTSRAAQAPGVKKIYDKNRNKTSQSPPLWAWVLAALMLVGTGIFAAPALLRQFGNGTKPPNNLALPTLPKAPLPQAVSKPNAVKPAQAKPKPVSKPVAQPAQAKKPTPVVAKPTPKPVTKPIPAQTAKPNPVTPQIVQTPKPAPKPVSKPTPKPQVVPPKPAAVVVDAQSAANLPPIAAKPTPKPAPKPAAKPAPKPAAKPAPKPAPKPVAKPAPKPVVVPVTPEPAPAVAPPTPATQAAAPAETIDPNNLTREQIGRRFLNEKYFEDWLARGAKVRYASWAEIPIALQVAALPDFRAAVLIALP